MHITKQLNSNECGVCVVNSLVNHYYGVNDKQTILNKANLSKDGLTLYDFETLCMNFNIYAESYTMDYVEFIEYTCRDYLVCLINKDKAQHYVIVKKHHKHIEVYDSIDGYYQTSYEKFKDSYFGVVVLVSKAKTRIKLEKIGKIDILKNINVTHLLVALILQVIVVGLNMLISNYLNILINNSIQNQLVRNGIIISFIFLLFFVLQELIKWILQWINIKQFKINYQYLSSTYINSVLYKKRGFMNKIQSSFLFLSDSCITTIVSFLTQEISTFIANLVLVFISSILLAYFNPWLLVPQIISCVIAIICGYIEYVYNKGLLIQCINSQSTNCEITSDLINKFIPAPPNIFSRTFMRNNIQHNYSQLLSFYIRKNRFMQRLNFIENVLQYIIYIVVVLLFSFVMTNNETTNIGKMTYVIAIQALCINSFNSLCGMINKKYEYKKMSEIYNLCVNTNNILLSDGQRLESIESITYRGKPILKETIINDEFFNTLCLENNEVFFINNKNIKHYSARSYIDLLLVIDGGTWLDKKILWKNIDLTNKDLLPFLQKHKINLTNSESLSYKQQQIGWLLLCASIKNKLIIINKKLINEHENIFELIKQSNYVLFYGR
ncbi:MAG: hypothetical protein LBG49_02440 [Mycoplasmataceae bacterium]|nr:hypothetical protein [Mycoplasmataceae bacterium]